MHEILLGKHLTLQEFCTCTQTYWKYADSLAIRGRARIDPYPKNMEETLPALEALCQHILDPVIGRFGRERFQLTYRFCSKDLKRFLSQKDPETGIKHGRVDPSRDQRMAHEKNRNGKYYCSRLGAAYDFRIVGLKSFGDSLCNSTYRLVEWILEHQLPFDSLYYYGSDSRSETLSERPIHISYSPKQRRAIWGFTDGGVPTKKGIEQWLERVEPRF